MSKKNKKFSSVEIIDIGSKGQSIAKSDDGIVLMVKKGVPGDVVDIETYRKKKNYSTNRKSPSSLGLRY